MKLFKLKIPSLTDNLRLVESFIDQAREDLQFDEDIYGNIVIAVTEAVNNAIVHGNQNDKEKNVDLSVGLSDDNQLLFVIEDEGPGFDYNALPDPTAPEFLEQPGGRGIFLIRHLADEVKFQKDGARIEMTFYL